MVFPYFLFFHISNERQHDICSYSGTSVKARECALQHVLRMGGILLTT